MNWNTPDKPLGPDPDWDNDDAYQVDKEHAGHGDDLWDQDAYYKVEDLLNTTLWDDDTKDDFWMNWDNAVDAREVTNAVVQEPIEYLYQYQPRVPFSEVKNPTQKQISAFIRKVCNL